MTTLAVRPIRVQVRRRLAGLGDTNTGKFLSGGEIYAELKARLRALKRAYRDRPEEVRSLPYFREEFLRTGIFDSGGGLQSLDAILAKSYLTLQDRGTPVSDNSPHATAYAKLRFLGATDEEIRSFQFRDSGGFIGGLTRTIDKGLIALAPVAALAAPVIIGAVFGGGAAAGGAAAASGAAGGTAAGGGLLPTITGALQTVLGPTGGLILDNVAPAILTALAGGSATQILSSFGGTLANIQGEGPIPEALQLIGRVTTNVTAGGGTTRGILLTIADVAKRQAGSLSGTAADLTRHFATALEQATRATPAGQDVDPAAVLGLAIQGITNTQGEGPVADLLRLVGGILGGGVLNSPLATNLPTSAGGGQMSQSAYEHLHDTIPRALERYPGGVRLAQIFRGVTEGGGDKVSVMLTIADVADREGAPGSPLQLFADLLRAEIRSRPPERQGEIGAIMRLTGDAMLRNLPQTQPEWEHAMRIARALGATAPVPPPPAAIGPLPQAPGAPPPPMTVSAGGGGGGPGVLLIGALALLALARR